VTQCQPWICVETTRGFSKDHGQNILGGGIIGVDGSIDVENVCWRDERPRSQRDASRKAT